MDSVDQKDTFVSSCKECPLMQYDREDGVAYCNHPNGVFMAVDENGAPPPATCPLRIATLRIRLDL